MPDTSRTSWAWYAVAAGFLLCENSAAQWLYTAEVNRLGEGYVHRIDLQTFSAEIVLETTGGLRGLDVAIDSGFGYWSNVDSGTIYRSPRDDLMDATPIVEGLVFPQDISFSKPLNALVWTDPGDDTIGVSTLLGGNERVLVSGVLSSSVAVDESGGWVYFEDRTTAERGAIKRIRLDGTGLATIIDDVPTATDIALDVGHGYVYWGSSAGFDNTGGIYRVRLDGTGFEEVYKSDIPRRDAISLAIDAQNSLIYFGLENGGAGTTEIYRVGLNGEDPTFLMGGFDLIPDMSILIPAPPALAPLALAALLAARRPRQD